MVRTCTHAETENDGHSVDAENHSAEGEEWAVGEGEGAGTEHGVNLWSEFLLELEGMGQRPTLLEKQVRTGAAFFVTLSRLAHPAILPRDKYLIGAG